MNTTARIGDGGTIRVGSDLYACTVVAVGPRSVSVRRDKARRVDSNGLSEIQEWSHEPDPDAELETFTRPFSGGSLVYRARCWRVLTIGERRSYRDPSF